MRAAKGRISAFFFAALSLLLASSAFASIPRTTAFDPPAIDRYALADDANASIEVLPLHDQLARAARVSWPIESLPETRVGVSELFTPLEHQQHSELSRALHHAYAHLTGENASDQTFCAGDPVNCRDPRGEGILDEAKWYWRGMKEAPAAFASGVKGAVKMVASPITGLFNYVYEGVGNTIYEATGAQAYAEQHEAWAKRRESFQRHFYGGPQTIAEDWNSASKEFNARLGAGDVNGASEILGGVGAQGLAMSQLPPGEGGPAPALATASGTTVPMSIPRPVAVPVAAPILASSPHLTNGKEWEAQQQAEAGETKNTTVRRPTAAEAQSALFQILVGKAKKTKSGQFVGTIVDTAGENASVEYKHGTSTLNYATYQLRLQMFFAIKEGLPYVIRTTRPLSGGFADWLEHWGGVAEPK